MGFIEGNRSSAREPLILPSMKNALAVYTPKSPLNGRKLADHAQKHGITLRFMALGGFIPGNAIEIQNKALAAVNGGALLLVGAFESDAATLAEFDELIERGNRPSIAAMLEDAKLPWCELYTGRFDYEKTIKTQPKDKHKIDGSVPPNRLLALKAAKTRYIIYNQSCKKDGGQLRTCLAEALSAETDGIVADYQRPSR